MWVPAWSGLVLFFQLLFFFGLIAVAGLISINSIVFHLYSRQYYYCLDWELIHVCASQSGVWVPTWFGLVLFFQLLFFLGLITVAGLMWLSLLFYYHYSRECYSCLNEELLHFFAFQAGDWVSTLFGLVLFFQLLFLLGLIAVSGVVG